MNAKEFRAWKQKIAAGMPLTLPSGLEARVRNIPLREFMRSGAIPDSLTPVVMELIQGEAKLEKHGMNTLYEAQTQMQRAVTRMALVSPRIVDDPQGDDELSIDDMEEEDMEVLMGLLGRSARELEPFCQEQNESMAALQAGTTLPETSVAGDQPEPVVSGDNGSARKR